MAKKAELKTKETAASVDDFINGLGDEAKSADCRVIAKLMQEATGSEPKMWGEAIVGFGNRLYKYASGRELDWFDIGFSPRKANITLYLHNMQLGDASDILARLGKHKLGKGCLYINKLADVDTTVLKELITKMAEKK